MLTSLVFCFFDSQCTYQTVTSVISVHFCCTGVWESLRKHLSEMYAVRFTQFSSSVASAAGAVVQRQTVMLGRCPVKLSANKVACLRSFASESGSRASTLRRVKSSSLKEKLLAPAGDSGLQHVLKYTHTQLLKGPLSWTTWVSRYQKGKTNLDFTEARDSVLK